MFLRLFYITCFLLTTLSFHAQSLQQSNFSRYSIDEGLSHNHISDIKQDSTGYIWVATLAGLNRFNGTQFVQFHSSNDSLSLPAEELTNTTWLDKNRLGVFSSGLHIVNTKTGSTRNLFIPYHDKKYQFKFNMVVAATGDENDNIYVLTRSGFYHYDNNYKLVSRFDYFREADVPIRHFQFGSGLYTLDANRFLIVAVGGLYIYDRRVKKFRKLTAADCPLLKEFLDYSRSKNYQFFQTRPQELFVVKSNSDTITYIDLNNNRKLVSQVSINPLSSEIGWRSRMVRVSDTLFYITGHDAGFFKMKFAPSTGIIKIDPEKLFPNYLCYALLKDADNNLWIGTNRGLFRENARKPVVQTSVYPANIVESYSDARIFDLYVSDRKVYVGTNQAGLLIYDKRSLSYEQQILPTKYQSSNHIRAIAEVDSSTLMLGTHGPLLLLNTTSNSLSATIPPNWNVARHWTGTLHKDKKKNVWISSYNIYKYNPASKVYSEIPVYAKLLDVPFVMSEDRDGNIWMGCHGIARYNISLNKYDVYIDSFPFIKMSDKQVGSMVIDDQNILWFNSNNNGLIAYDIDKKTFRHFTRKNGLPDDNIASLLAIGDKVWIACFSGVACIDTRSFQIVSFGQDDGFPNMPIVKGSRMFHDKAANQLYVGFAQAVARFNPDSILRKKQSPRIFIENLVINGNKNYFLPGNSITTSWRDDELQVTIGTINFRNGDAQQFAYRIAKDSSSPWINLGSQPSFSISGLQPGTHRIQVKTFSPSNRWPEQVKEIAMVVTPPFWRKPWFFLLMGILLFSLIHLLVKWRTGVARKKEMIKTHLEALKADHYKNQFELEQVSNYFSSSLAGKRSADEVLWDVASNLIGRMGYEYCVIYLWNKEKTKMVQKAAWGPKGKPEIIRAAEFDVAPGEGIVGQVILTRQPILVSDTRKDPRYRVDDQFRLSEVAVPIIHNNELLGVVDSENSRQNYYSQRDIKILTTIATLIGNKLKQFESEKSLEAKQKELVGINEQLAEARLSALQAQMNPHFVFNALNSIKRMILDADNEKASRYLSKFALMIRMTLEHSKQIFVTLDENIEYLKAYLDMEKLRFDDSFTYSIETDENVDTTETVLPSMMIQPLVENAIWHGLMHAENDKKIQVSFSQSQNRIICTVEDNGIGIQQSERLREKHRPLHRSVGLENLQKRIKIMNEKYNTDCSLQITDLNGSGHKGKGTRVTLQFNLMNA